MDTHETDERKVIETASATTSPDNENSGMFAYVVTAVTAVALLLVSLVSGVIISAVIAFTVQSGALDEVVEEFGGSTANPLDMESDPINEYFEQYNDLFSDKGDTDSEDRTTNKSVTVSEALDFDLAPYLISLDAKVPASSYAGTPEVVRDFVRQIMATDTDYSDKIRSALNAGASDTENQATRIKEAKDLCAAAKEALDALEIPSFEGVEDSTVRDLIGEAKGEAARRFELMAAEIELLETDDTVDTSRLWAADDEVVAACENAADKIIEAMSTAAAH